MAISDSEERERKSSATLGAKKINGKRLFARFGLNYFVLEDFFICGGGAVMNLNCLNIIP